MPEIRQDFAWWCFQGSGLEPKELLREAARIGYAGVELADPDLWPLIREAGLRVVSAGGHDSIESGLNRQENHDRIEKEVTRKAQLASDWDVPHLICFSGNRDGLDDERGAETTAEGLRRLAPIAEQSGVTLVLELLNSKVNHKDYQCDQTEWGVRVCEMVGSPNVKLLYDIYHMQIMEGDIIRTIEQHHRHVGHYHTAGNPGRHEIHRSNELNYGPIFAAIRETGYTGWIGHEFVPLGDPIESLEAAYKLVSSPEH